MCICSVSKEFYSKSPANTTWGSQPHPAPRSPYFQRSKSPCPTPNSKRAAVTGGCQDGQGARGAEPGLALVSHLLKTQLRPLGGELPGVLALAPPGVGFRLRVHRRTVEKCPHLRLLRSLELFSHPLRSLTAPQPPRVQCRSGELKLHSASAVWQAGPGCLGDI